MRPLDSAEAEKLSSALRWLKSHRKRLEIDQRSLAARLAKTNRELDRLDREIEIAESRLQSHPVGNDR